jgi:hypothetical protein
MSKPDKQLLPLPLPVKPSEPREFYFRVDGSQKDIDELNKTGEACSAVYHSVGSINTREPFTRRDYDTYRPNERMPYGSKEIIRQCNEAYRKVGVVKNIIDLMSDFGSQGIVISHPSRKTEKVLRAWFDKVNGLERSERFLNDLYKSGVVITKRINGTTPDGNIIPVRYTYLDPCLVEVANPRETKLGATPQYVLRPYNSTACDSLIEFINYEVTRRRKDVAPELTTVVDNIHKDVPLDPNTTIIHHYKKDDFTLWADPIIYCVLDSVILYQKAQLADMAALDGAIQSIRLIKLGNSEKGIYPKPAAIETLHAILGSNTGGGPIDLIWTDDIDIKQVDTQVHTFLGSAKYDPILTAIYDGLGVPSTVTAKSGAGTGFTNNALSLRVLIERLEYGRNQLIKFWTQEIKLVQKALGLKKEANVSFAQTLNDDVAKNNLLMSLADRGYISWETIVERVGENVAVEKSRLHREVSDRESGRLPEKLGPFQHNADDENPEGEAGEGRPMNKVDTTTRKKRTPKIKPI